jgi:serine/threonine protein phosphatase PrpC
VIKSELSFLNQGQRPLQEDAILVNQEKGIFVVADGFGGGQAGLGAANTACEEVQRFLFKEAGDLDATLPFVLRSYFSLAGNVLFNALIHANRKVIAANKGKDIHHKGGASVIAGFLDADLLAIANVGACSASVIRDGKVQELVTPRSYGRLVDPFGDSLVDAPLMALGMSEDLEPEIFEYRIREGDILALYTDGVAPQLIQQLSLSPELNGLSCDILESSGYLDNAAITLISF